MVRGHQLNTTRSCGSDLVISNLDRPRRYSVSSFYRSPVCT